MRLPVSIFSDNRSDLNFLFPHISIRTKSEFRISNFCVQSEVQLRFTGLLVGLLFISRIQTRLNLRATTPPAAKKRKTRFVESDFIFISRFFL
jgi:hypothetical protein